MVPPSPGWNPGARKDVVGPPASTAVDRGVPWRGWLRASYTPLNPDGTPILRDAWRHLLKAREGDEHVGSEGESPTLEYERLEPRLPPHRTDGRAPPPVHPAGQVAR